MLEDEKACKALFISASREAPDEVRCRAFLALANVALQLRGMEASSIAQKIIKSLLIGTNQKEPADVRARIFGTLWSMAATSADLQQMWKNLDIRYAIAAAVSPDEDKDVRSNALALLWAMATSEVNRVPMWRDDLTRQALISAIAAGQPNSVRVNALHAMRSVGIIAELQETIWNDEEIQSLLLQASSIGQPDDVRVSAMRVIIELSSNPRNARNMAQAGIRAMLRHASEDEQLDPRDRHTCEIGATNLEGAEHYEDPEEILSNPMPDDPLVEEHHTLGSNSTTDGTLHQDGVTETATTEHPISQTQESVLLDAASHGPLASGVLARAGRGHEV